MNYLITGGEFNNKGAEAMTLTALKHIYAADPGAAVYMLDTGENRKYELTAAVTFVTAPLYLLNYLSHGYTFRDFLRWGKDVVRMLLPGRQSYVPQLSRLLKIFRSVDVMIDISGYALGSRWDEDKPVTYCKWIRAIAENGGKVYLMPQSFGPFEFEHPETLALVKHSLALCQKIFAREEEGYRALLGFGLTNVVKSADSVLLEQDADASALIRNYGQYVETFPLKNTKNAAIVPNYRLIDRGGYSLEQLLAFYSRVIDTFTDTDFYLTAHAGEDLELCRAVKERYPENERVILIDHVLLPFNYEALAGQLDFVIASRYHAIIHAYREGTPAVILGWAEKYREVAALFDQSHYLIDLNDEESDLAAVKTLAGDCGRERIHILETLREIQKSDCYSSLKELHEN